MQKIATSVCVVVPVYNAEKTLEALTGVLAGTLERFERWSAVFVDDASTDDSLNVLRRLCGQYNNVTAVALERNFGQQSAVLCGLHYSDCEHTVIIDDDLEQNPDDIFRLYEQIQQGYDVVYGVCESGGGKGAFRKMGSKLRDRLFERITDIPKGLKVCSFRMMNRQTVDKVLLADTRFVYISLEILKHTANIQNISVRQNTAAQSKYRLWKLASLLARMYVYYAPGRLLRLLRRHGDCYKIKQVIKGKRT